MLGGRTSPLYDSSVQLGINHGAELIHLSILHNMQEFHCSCGLCMDRCTRPTKFTTPSAHTAFRPQIQLYNVSKGSITLMHHSFRNTCYHLCFLFFFLKKRMTPGLCIWKMHTATLLIIPEDLTKCYNNKPESTN